MYTATYSPDDNKLRLYAASRLPKDEYDRVYAAGFRWAPVQKVFVAGMWTPDREDLLMELAGDIGDHDNSLMDRAEERAERFDTYQENRTRDAQNAHEAVSAITSGIPLGQPILVGHHSERRARKDQERIENGMRKALKMWQTAEYWKHRAAGAIRHAKYKELPDVRARRIKTIEADRRKRERSKAEAAEMVRRFALVDQPEKWQPRPDGSALTREERAYYMAGKIHGPYMATVRTEGANATELRYSAYDVLAPDDKRYKNCPAMTVDEVSAKLAAWCERVAAYNDRWIEHYDRRLDYEKAMLADQGKSELIAPKPRRKGNTIYPICNYRAPEGITVVDSYGNGPITYPQIEMTAAEYAAIHDDYKGTRVVEYSHRVRISFRLSKSACVFITDSKVHPKPAPGTAPERKPRRVYTPAEPREKTAAEVAIEQLQQGITAGVQVVSAPQLFPTPAEVAREMVEIADIQPGECVLEPQAGTGALVQAVVDSGVDTEILAYEINSALVQQLCGRWPSYRVQVRRADFLEVTDHQGCYPVILMNPPFINGEDIKHIEHARKFLARGGRLVGICAGGPRQTEKYRDYIVRELPPGTFEGTNVRSLLIRIDG